MKINKKVKEDFYKMVSLKIPRSKRREYIEAVYNCYGGFFFLSSFKEELERLSKEKVSTKKAVSRLEEMFNDISEGLMKANTKEYPSDLIF